VAVVVLLLRGLLQAVQERQDKVLLVVRELPTILHIDQVVVVVALALLAAMETLVQ
jgi:hypothetical protein